MKQKELVIESILGSEAENMIRKYFAVNTVNEVEGFILSEEEFLNQYKNTYAYNDLKTAKYHAIYTVNRCDICLKPFDAIINNRTHFYSYLQATYKLCNSCKIFHSSTVRMLGMQLDGDIAI